MKIDELIEKLEVMKMLHGNVEVCHDTPGGFRLESVHTSSIWPALSYVNNGTRWIAASSSESEETVLMFMVA